MLIEVNSHNRICFSIVYSFLGFTGNRVLTRYEHHRSVSIPSQKKKIISAGFITERAPEAHAKRVWGFASLTVPHART